MSELYDAMLQHMTYLVKEEYRPFSYRDFLFFSANGQEYKMAHGTIRNYFSKLRKDEKIELVRNSGLAFYTLKGVDVGKAITPNHTGIDRSNPFYLMINDLPLNKTSIHNIRLKFHCPNIWSNLMSRSLFNSQLNPISKDIRLASWIIDKSYILLVKVHKTDTVSVIIGCSNKPFPLDIPGIIEISNLLSRIEERISLVVKGSLDLNDCHIRAKIKSKDIIIPKYKQWIVIMWHLNADSKTEYTGEKFSIKWEIAQKIIIQIYSKKFKNKKTRIRLERQEYPRKTLS